MAKHTRCPKCDGKMEAGFIPEEKSESNTTLSLWAEGKPKRKLFMGIEISGISTKKLRTYPIVAHRCAKCGHLELSAPEGSDKKKDKKKKNR